MRGYWGTLLGAALLFSFDASAFLCKKNGYISYTNGGPYHDEIVSEALKELRNSGYAIPFDTSYFIKDAAVSVDLPGLFGGNGMNTFHYAHVDDMTRIQEVENYLADFRQAVREILNELPRHNSRTRYTKEKRFSCRCGRTAAYTIGLIAHSVHDFYHHTDWVFKKSNRMRVQMDGQWIELPQLVAPLWDETEKGADGILGGYWAKGTGNRNKRDPKFQGTWFHDPFGNTAPNLNEEGDLLPVPPYGFNRRYLLDVAGAVAKTHTLKILNELLGSADTVMTLIESEDHCSAIEDADNSIPVILWPYESNWKECFADQELANRVERWRFGD